MTQQSSPHPLRPITADYRVLLELRPALDGYAGIPQETRLLFRGLCQLPNFGVSGLLQTSHRYLPSGINDSALSGLADDSINPPAKRFHRMARVVIALETVPTTVGMAGVFRYLRNKRVAWRLALYSLFRPTRHLVGLSCFIPKRFEDYLWRHLFSRTLPPEDFSIVTAQDFRVGGIPWNVLHTAGMNTLRWSKTPIYPLLDTRGFDFFIAQTPYPGRVSPSTHLIVRYHDAFPIFMPHTIAHKSRHEATHFHALSANAAAGAYFACVSESSRLDLLTLYPELSERAVTIANMVSRHFHDEPAAASAVPHVIRSRINRSRTDATADLANRDAEERFYSDHLHLENLRYVLVVSTIEPRKNHERLIAAWERVRNESDPDLKLVVVGNFGWDCESTARIMRPWITRGALFALANVPADDLRVLYQHAVVTVCPSLAEGFDFSGVEAMRCGGVVIASDIPVHREVYDDAAEYFDPYCTSSLASAFQRVLFENTSTQLRDQLRIRGREVSSRYLPEKILPLWDQLFDSIRKAKNFVTHD